MQQHAAAQRTRCAAGTKELREDQRAHRRAGGADVAAVRVARGGNRGQDLGPRGRHRAALHRGVLADRAVAHAEARRLCEPRQVPAAVH